MAEFLTINEIFLSVQGESTFAGLPCVFVRLTACNLRCSYCDTAYAFVEGQKTALDAICERVQSLAAPFRQRSQIGRLPLVELTGGEPLLQPNSLPLMQRFCDAGFTVLLETSGAHDIAPVDPRVRRIMDLKCPSSGEAARNRWENIPHLRNTDEVKFVIGTHEDLAWAIQTIEQYGLAARCPLLFSWAFPLEPDQQDRSLKKILPNQTPLTRQELAERILAEALPVRLQFQLHKFIWPPAMRGV
jgi:7-carboxy-7-deazaguanine synthase